MYYKIQRQILDLIDTIKEMQVHFINNPIDVPKYKEDCVNALQIIQKTIEDEVKEKVEVLEYLYDIYRNGEKIIQNTDGIFEKLDQLITVVQSFPIKWRMVFLPYKASMWNSMESIWKEAIKDDRCEVQVMCLPYMVFDGEGMLQKVVCETEQFPEYVDITSATNGVIEHISPEFIIIHNPYDEYNNLTRVPEEYYAKNLRNYTLCLVYTPYFTFFGSDKESLDRLIYSPGNLYSDKIIVQSDIVAQHYKDRGMNEKKLLVIGSPKLDAIINMKKDKIEMPVSWKEKLAGRKSILYTFSLNLVFQTERLKNLLIKMKEHWKDEDLGFIFRPHPLLRDFCKNRTENEKIIQEIFEFIEQDDRIVLDTNESYLPAFCYSDGFMVYDATSLLNEYLMTGKPIYWDYADSDRIENQEEFVLDFRGFYCVHSEQLEAIKRGEDIQEEGEFFRAVKFGEDVKKELRYEISKRCFHRVDGRVGEEVYKALVKELENRDELCCN